MGFAERCLNELKRLTNGYLYIGELYFTLAELRLLPTICKPLGNQESLIITPYFIGRDFIMEVYWCELIIESVDQITDKFDELLSESGKSSLEEIDQGLIDQWDNTHYQVLNDDTNGFLESLQNYIVYMEKRETDLRMEFDTEIDSKRRLVYKIW